MEIYPVSVEEKDLLSKGYKQLVLKFNDRSGGKPDGVFEERSMSGVPTGRLLRIYYPDKRGLRGDFIPENSIQILAGALSQEEVDACEIEMRSSDGSILATTYGEYKKQYPNWATFCNG